MVLTDGNVPPRVVAQVPRHDGHVECQALRGRGWFDVVGVLIMTFLDINILVYLRHSQLIIIVEPAH